MIPLHPALVHYPIAFAMAAALFQLLAVLRHKPQFTVSALIALGVAGLAAIAAAVTGTAQEELVGGISQISDTLSLHENLGTLSAALLNAVALGALYLYLKERLPDLLFLLVLMGLSALLIVTGHWGGVLVYQFGAGGPY